MRAVALDVHRDFCEVAILAEGRLRSAAGSQTRPEALELFAQSLDPRDRVALEVTGNAWAIARILEPHVARVIVVSPSDTGIRQARAKTDRLDARALAKLLWAGELDGVWTPDERIRAMRRRLARRSQLVRARSRAKNEIHAVLDALPEGPPAGVGSVRRQGPGLAGRAAAAAHRARDRRPGHAPGRVPRREIAAGRAADRRRGAVLARGQAADDRPRGQRDRRRDVHGRRRRHPPLPRSPQADRLSRPGSARQTVRRGPGKPRPHLQAGLSSARHALVEACWSTVRQPGPIAGFYQRVTARRGHSIAIVASARKLACLFWCLLTRGEDYAFAQPSLTTKKMRRLELTAGAPRWQGGHGVWSTNTAMRHAERELALQAQRAYERTVKDRQQKKGASATPGRASSVVMV